METTDQPQEGVKGIVEIAKAVRDQIRSVTGWEVINVASLQPSEDTWSGRVEVIELRRTPDTQDLVGVYEVELDRAGNLLAWERVALRVKGDPTSIEDVMR